MKYKMCSFDTIRTEFSAAVKSAYENKSVDILQKKFDSIKAGDTDKRTVLDQVTRDYLLHLLSQGSDDVYNWESFVNFCILACRRDMCNPTMPVVLLGDVFDAITLDQCEKLFEFVEKGVNVWKEELFFSACKNNLLRMCNDLLRRLSRSQNTVFCGRILLFLAKFFPFSERSGLNIVSEFNLDNLTEFGNDTSSPLKDIITDPEVDGAEEEAKPDNKFKIDYNLYCKFWALQDFFRNPNQCYNKVNWKTFSTHAVNVLLAFSSFKLEEVQGKQVAPAPSSSTSTARPHYFAKFLTNQKLLELQLSDSNFRRYVLLQFLIVFQYLHSPVKFKTESHELKAEQAEWVKDTTQLVHKLLAETPPDGPAFVQAVQHILKREEHWNAWKNDGCPEFTQPAPRSPGGGGVSSGDGGEVAVGTSDDVLASSGGAGDGGGGRRTRGTTALSAGDAAGVTSTRGTVGGASRPRRGRKRLGDIVREAAAHKRFYMGNGELTRLWNLCPNNLDACKSRERDFLPSLEAYFEEAIEQTDPAALVEDQYKRVNDGNFGWRALRLLARRSPHFFTHSNNPINKLPEYLENMIKKISKDRPLRPASPPAPPPPGSSPTAATLANVDPGDAPPPPPPPSIFEECLQSGGDDAVRADVDTEMQTNVKEEEEEELLKGGGGGAGEGGDDDADGAEGDDDAGDGAPDALPPLSPRRLAATAAAIAPQWRRLAAKLGYRSDEILYFESQRSDDAARCRHMLEIWAEDEEEDAPAAQLAYVLGGLGADGAAALMQLRGPSPSAAPGSPVGAAATAP